MTIGPTQKRDKTWLNVDSYLFLGLFGVWDWFFQSHMLTFSWSFGKEKILLVMLTNNNFSNSYNKKNS